MKEWTVEETIAKIEELLAPYGVHEIKKANKVMEANFTIAQKGMYRNDSLETTMYYDLVRPGVTFTSWDEDIERYYYDFWNKRAW